MRPTASSPRRNDADVGARAKCTARSRSHPRAGLAGRHCALTPPAALRGTWVAFPDLDSAEARALAVDELKADYYATSSIPGVHTRIHFLHKAFGKWGQEP